MAQIGGSVSDATAKTFSQYVISSRPSLLFRNHSDRLRVQAYAKSLRRRLLSGPTVDIFVGDEKRHWSLHRNLLAYHSEYLKAELLHSVDATPKSKTKATSEGLRLDLENDDPVGFELLVKWLYQGKLDDISSLSDEQEKYDYAVACQKLHNLCDRFEMPKLKNIAMDQYRKGLSEAGLVPDAEELDVIYRQSPKASPFRKLMVKIAARQMMDPDSEKDAESYRHCFENNPDFAIDLINAIKLGTGGVLFDDPTGVTDCEFHDHDNGPDCHQKGKKKIGTSTSPTTRSRRPSPPKSPKINGVSHNGGDGTSPLRATAVGGSNGGHLTREGFAGRRTPSPPDSPSSPSSSLQAYSVERRRPPPKLRRKISLES